MKFSIFFLAMIVTFAVICHASEVTKCKLKGKCIIFWIYTLVPIPKNPLPIQIPTECNEEIEELNKNPPSLSTSASKLFAQSKDVSRDVNCTGTGNWCSKFLFTVRDQIFATHSCAAGAATLPAKVGCSKIVTEMSIRRMMTAMVKNSRSGASSTETSVVCLCDTDLCNDDKLGAGLLTGAREIKSLSLTAFLTSAIVIVSSIFSR